MVAVHTTAPTLKEAMSVPALKGLFWRLMVEAAKLMVCLRCYRDYVFMANYKMYTIVSTGVMETATSPTHIIPTLTSLVYGPSVAVSS